jgi:hypothetical protein
MYLLFCFFYSTRYDQQIGQQHSGARKFGFNKPTLHKRDSHQTLQQGNKFFLTEVSYRISNNTFFYTVGMGKTGSFS